MRTFLTECTSLTFKSFLGTREEAVMTVLMVNLAIQQAEADYPRRMAKKVVELMMASYSY